MPRHQLGRSRCLGDGFDTHSVAGVWIGRPDGSAVPGFTGAGTALPVLADVFGLLPAAPRSVAAGDEPSAPQAARPEAAIHLLFPPPGATLSADGPVPLRAIGGRRPLIFTVDGSTPPSVPARRGTLWTPAGPGFYTLGVQDADGAMVRAQVRIR